MRTSFSAVHRIVQRLAVGALATAGVLHLYSQEPKPVFDPSLSLNWVREESTRIERAGDPQRESLRQTGVSRQLVNHKVVEAFKKVSWTHQTAATRVTNQARAPMCLFHSMSAMQASLLRQAGKVGENFEFSASHFLFYSVLQSANRYLNDARLARDAGESAPLVYERLQARKKILGNAHERSYVQVVSHWGMMPKDAMPITSSLLDPSLLLRDLQDLAAAFAADILDAKTPVAAIEIQERGMKDVLHLLIASLGAPPATFEFEGRVYTAESFRDQFVRFDPNAFVVVTKQEARPAGAAFEVSDTVRGVPSGSERPNEFSKVFLNLSIDRVLELVDAAIAQGIPVPVGTYFTGGEDVGTGILDERLIDRDRAYGTDYYSRTSGLSQVQVSRLGLTYSTHSMLIDAISKPDANRPAAYYRIRNSWGTDKAGREGRYAASADWVRRNGFHFAVPVSLLQSHELDALRKPTVFDGADRF